MWRILDWKGGRAVEGGDGDTHWELRAEVAGDADPETFIGPDPDPEPNFHNVNPKFNLKSINCNKFNLMAITTDLQSFYRDKS